MDVLSEVLKVVKLQGALFYNGELSAPWSVRAPSSNVIARYLPSAAEHVAIYHLLTEGRASARLAHGGSIALDAGDIAVLPHGHAHTIGNGAPGTTLDLSEELERVFSEGLKVSRQGGGGESTRFVCGYVACEPRLSRVLLSGLPPLFKVRIRDEASGRWLEDAIRFSLNQAGAVRPGGAAVLARLSEVLFVETLRTYAEQLPPEQTGWLAGARDPEVGRALALIHRDPARRWTLLSLAKEAGVRPTVLSERFVHYLGGPPMAYLRHWRLQLAAHMLASGRQPVAQIAADVGYPSEAAFNRAFQHEFDGLPARFRSRSRAAQAVLSPAPRGRTAAPRRRRRRR
jgi:AraC-like DNA-binding protein